MPADFSDVQLSEAETEELVYNERLRRYFEAKGIQANEQKQAEYLQAREPFTAEELFAYICRKYPAISLDQQALKYFKLLSWYFTDDARFTEAGYDLNKGLAIVGVPGCGKTTLLECFQANKVAPFHLVSINDIHSYIQDRDINAYKTYCLAVPGWGHKQQFFFAPQVYWAIDDVGLEEQVNDYGNKAFIFSKIIQFRYSHKDQIPFRTLHFTSMLTPDQIEAKYGGFIRSRLREMFNFIQYEGGDRRK